AGMLRRVNVRKKRVNTTAPVRFEATVQRCWPVPAIFQQRHARGAMRAAGAKEKARHPKRGRAFDAKDAAWLQAAPPSSW
ncbi:MAG: hypothetical protein ACRC1O_13825, partial [Ralstonia mannitolilytica]